MGRKDSAESRFLGTRGFFWLLLMDSRTISIHTTHSYDVIHVCCLNFLYVTLSALRTVRIQVLLRQVESNIVVPYQRHS